MKLELILDQDILFSRVLNFFYTFTFTQKLYAIMYNFHNP